MFRSTRIGDKVVDFAGVLLFVSVAVWALHVFDIRAVEANYDGAFWAGYSALTFMFIGSLMFLNILNYPKDLYLALMLSVVYAFILICLAYNIHFWFAHYPDTFHWETEFGLLTSLGVVMFIHKLIKLGERRQAPAETSFNSGEHAV